MPSRDRQRPWVSVLEADPDLGEGLPDSERAAASQRAVAPVIRLEADGWGAGPVPGRATEAWLGLLMLDGLMLRRVSVGRRSACELCGPGDLLRPWGIDGHSGPLGATVTWRVLRPVRLAVLDDGFVTRVAPWPIITTQLTERVARRARFLAVSQAVTHSPKVHARLLMLFWLLAERWGRVTPDGIRVELPLTHEIIALVAGVQRPSVTIGLRRLSDAGLLTREQPHSWLLASEGADLVADAERLGVLLDGSVPPPTLGARAPALDVQRGNDESGVSDPASSPARSEVPANHGRRPRWATTRISPVR